jgi:5-methylcytosine-specific restriction endonuclease McrA
MSERASYFRCDASWLSSTLSAMAPNEAVVFTVLMLRVMDKGRPADETLRSLSRRTNLSVRRVEKALASLLGDGHVTICPDRRLDVPSTHREIARQQTPAAQREYQGKPQRDLPLGWTEIKRLVFSRDGMICAYCGDTSGPFDIDHVIPYSRGGQNTPENLCVACKPCNQAKGSKLLAEWLS